jgi:hypothetical protein
MKSAGAGDRLGRYVVFGHRLAGRVPGAKFLPLSIRDRAV